MAMKVYELIAELQKMPQDMQVVMSQDEEGNGYSPYIEVDNERDQCVVLYPGSFDYLDEVVENYEPEEDEE